MRRNKSLIFLLSFLVFFTSRIISFKPDPRYSQTSIIVSTKLYYAGGYINNSIHSDETFYLDLLNSFQTSSPPWVSLAKESIPVSPDYSTTIVNPLDNSTIYLIGGYMVNPTTSQVDANTLVFTFDTKGLKWNPLSTTNGSARQEIDAVVDNSGKIYIFGGRGANTNTYYNDVNILDINTNYWENIQATSNSPSLRSGYTATLLPNGIIVYIGGWTGVDLIADLKQLQLFNTKDLSWASVNSTGGILSGRRFHTAVLTADNKIIIYGGEDRNNSLVSPSLAVLDTSSYNWNILNPSNSPPSLSQHSANLYGNYMIVAFGFITNAQGSETSLNENLYVLDTTNYTWVDQFISSPSPTSPSTSIPSGYTTPTSSDPTEASNNNKGIIIGLSVALGLLGLVGIFGLIFYLKKKRTHEEIIRIAGEGDVNTLLK